MARNRKRAKERRARQPQPVIGATNGAPEDEAPNPIAHASPDVELAEAQLALGRPDLADAQAAPETESGVEDVDELDDEEFEDLEDEVDAAGAGGGRGGPPSTDTDQVDGGGGGRPKVRSSSRPRSLRRFARRRAAAF